MPYQTIDPGDGPPGIALISTHGYVAADPPLGAADTGGQVVYVLELSKQLAQLGYRVDVLTRQFEDQPAEEPVADNVRILRFPCGGAGFIPKEYLHRHLLVWSELALRYLAAHGVRYDFINSHYWDGGVAGQRLSEALGVPHLHTPHSLGIWKKRQMETDYPERAADLEAEFNFTERIRNELIVLRSCDAVVATTPVQLDMLIEDYSIGRERIRMIPPGYDDSRFYPVSSASRALARRRLGFANRTILCLGRLASNKGYDLLLNAFAVVARRVEDVHLRLAVGGKNLDDNEEHLLEALISQVKELDLGERVTLSGFVPDEDLADTYRAADLFVLPSRYEPFGMTAIEAMACGTPTVVTVHGGLYRAVSYGRHALFADPFDPEDLGITMLKPLQYGRLHGRLSRMGAHKARSLFTWTGIAQQLIAVTEGRHTPMALEDQEWAEPWNDGD